MKGALEKQRLFPYLAWGTVGVLMIGVFFLVGELRTQGKEMSARTDATIEALLNDDFSHLE